MNIPVFIQMNMVSCVLCLLLFYQQKKHKSFDFLGSTAFISILWTAVVIMLLDTVSWLVIGNVLPMSDRFLLIVQSLYYFTQALLPLLFLMYCINTNGKRLSYGVEALLYLPLLFNLIVLMINFDSHFALSITEGRAMRADGFIFAILSPMVYIIICLIFNVFFFISASQDNKKVTFHLFVSVLISFAGAILSAVSTAFNPWHIFVFALVYLYMQMHSDQEVHLDNIAYKDLLTGFNNYASYSNTITELDKLIKADEAQFAVVMMDVNGLKGVNDRYGHEAGNSLITSSTGLISRVFADSSIYRIGGDEFVAILTDEDYTRRASLLALFDVLMDGTKYKAGGKDFSVSIAIGMAEYDPAYHKCYNDVFHMADDLMYRNKAFCRTCHPVKE